MGEQAHQCLSAIEVHRKLGHISQKSLKYLLEHNMILGIEKQSIGDKINCDACIQSKITRKPLPKEPRECSKKLGD
jgi:GAG-pre-integrase domain